MKGTIKKVMRDKFFGFIAVDGGKDIFFHKNDLDGGDAAFMDLQEGLTVSFETQDSPKGPKAVNIVVEA